MSLFPSCRSRQKELISRRKGGFGQDYFTLRSTYLQGRPPKSVNMYWRRFAVSSIPVSDPKEFEAWLMKVWREKDELLQYFADHGRFPPSDGAEPGFDPAIFGKKISKADAAYRSGYIETEVKLAHWIEIGQIFVILAALALVANVVVKLWNAATSINAAFA